MTETKAWHQSKTIWGSIIAVLAALASALGHDIDDQSQALLAEALLQLATVGGSLWAIFGRLTATAEIE